MTTKRRFPPDSAGSETIRFDCEIGRNATKRWCFDHAQIPPCRGCLCGACERESEREPYRPGRLEIVVLKPDERFEPTPPPGVIDLGEMEWQLFEDPSA